MSEQAVLETRGRIFEIQRFSIHDGPGIRTTVFLQGCPLDCIWCHNPEGASDHPLLSFLPSKCVGCGECLRVCPHEAHRIGENGEHLLDREACTACGRCAEVCYAGALELVGRETTAREVLETVVRDKPFYETSGGGMTVSGGEPTAQIDFTMALLQGAREEGLTSCVETCGFSAWNRLERLIPFVGLFLYDFKETDSHRHLELTGRPNGPILENLHRLHDAGASIRLRCPIIPGINDREDHFAAIARLASELPDLTGVELMPYHALGESKIDRFGLRGVRRAVAQTPERETVDAWCERLRALGVANLVNEPAAR